MGTSTDNIIENSTNDKKEIVKNKTKVNIEGKIYNKTTLDNSNKTIFDTYVNNKTNVNNKKIEMKPDKPIYKKISKNKRQIKNVANNTNKNITNRTNFQTSKL